MRVLLKHHKSERLSDASVRKTSHPRAILCLMRALQKCDTYICTWKGAHGLYDCIAFRLVANKTLTVSVRSQSNGRAWVGYKLQSTPRKKSRGGVNLFYFLLFVRTWNKLALEEFAIWRPVSHENEQRVAEEEV
jgi:hypothetical protein